MKREKEKGKGTLKGGGKGERRKGKGQATGFFSRGKLYLWIAPSIGYHCVPCVKGKEKEEKKKGK